MIETAVRLLPLFIGLLFLAGLSVPLTHRIAGKRLGLYLSLFPLLLFLSLLLLFPLFKESGAPVTPGFFELVESVNFSFRLDGLSVVFGMMISGIGFFVLLYSAYYMAGYDRQSHFYLYLMLFMGAMTGLVFADNLIALFIFWEITSVTSFLLIGFNHDSSKSRQAALQSLLITGFGGLCLLFAIILTGEASGTYRLSEMLASGFSLRGDASYNLVFVLVLIAVTTKSAQFPFHFWLPGAMQAPTPVSSYLHSATMVNAGIFLLLRVNPILGDTALWQISLIFTGGITMFLGALFSLGQNDLKRILAFTTISALGTMVILIGIDTVQSIKAAILFFIVHALYKGGLFMMAGIIDKSTGTRDVTVLSKLGRGLPMTSLAGLLALISMAGLPPMLGFIGKELIYEAKLETAIVSWVALPLGIGANMIMVAISITLVKDLFITGSATGATPLKYRESQYPWYFMAGTAVLAISGLILGLVPGVLDLMVGHALGWSLNSYGEVHLSIWHGFNKALVASIITVLLGITLFRYRTRVKPVVVSLIAWFDKMFLPELFASAISKFMSVAASNTKRLQHGYHRFYLITFFVVILLLLLIYFLSPGGGVAFPDRQYTPFRLNVVLMLFISSLAVLFAVFSKGRLSAILAMGVVGYGIAMLYLFFGAIDISITQFLIETILMVLFVMVVIKLPRFAVLSTPGSRLRDGIISVAFGAVVTIVLLNVRLIDLNEPVSTFYAERAYIESFGRNIVNVIHVDFRPLDIVGEITVLTLSAVGVYALFNIKVKRASKGVGEEER